MQCSEHAILCPLRRAAAYVLLGLSFVACCAASPLAANGSASASRPGVQVLESVNLILGKSVVLNEKQQVRRVSVAAPELVDLRLLSPTQIYLTGRAYGATNLTLWGTDDRVMKVYELSVVPDMSMLKGMLYQVMPEETGIRAYRHDGRVTLSGQVSSLDNLERALTLAQSYAPEGVVNLMHVGGVQQVQLQVKVAEMSRNVLERLGVNFSYFNEGNAVYSFLNSLTNLADDTANTGGLEVSDQVNGIVRAISGKDVWTGFLDALEQDGLVKVLAEPNMICLSGQSSNFLAGGEVPIPVPGALGTITIEYKPYGVGLKFTPTVMGDGRIGIKVAPEVSELDYANALNLDGYIIPALSTRKASTTVELKDGQSFAIAGLINSSVREGIDRVPALGDLPVLGALFRSSQFKKNETELVIIVTPHLVRPLDLARQSLPTDGYVEPTMVEFLLHGRLEGASDDDAMVGPVRPASASVPVTSGQGGFDGPVGHSLPGAPGTGADTRIQQ